MTGNTISPLPKHLTAGKGLRVSYTTSIQIVIQTANVYDCLIWINSHVIGAWMTLASVFKLYFLHTFLGKVPELGELNFDLQQERKKSRPLAFVHEPFLSYFKECWKWSLAPEEGSLALNALFRLVGGCFSSSARLSSPAASVIQSHPRCLRPPHTSLSTPLFCVSWLFAEGLRTGQPGPSRLPPAAPAFNLLCALVIKSHGFHVICPSTICPTNHVVFGV